jgi:sulfide dehydrogenase cytochrome subunit
MAHRKPTRPMNINLILLLAMLLAASATDAAEPAARRPDVERLAHACAGCHGTYGHSIAPTPAIAGLPEQAFLAAMREFKSGQRVSSAMNRIAKAYMDDDLSAMAQFFNKQ